MTEPAITINGVTLTPMQARAVHEALKQYQIDIAPIGKLRAMYAAHLSEVLRMMGDGRPDSVNPMHRLK